MNKAFMTFQKSLLLSLTGVMTIVATPAFSQSNSENKVSFRCDTSQLIPVTVAYNPSNQQQQPINIITWKQEHIDSQNIELDCKKAAETLGKRFNSKQLSETDYSLGVETKLLDDTNSQDKMTLSTVCLLRRSGGICQPNGSNQLVRIKTIVNNEEASAKTFSTIINPDFAELGRANLRTVGVTYPPIKSRTFWKRLFGLR